jgi:putative ABC transport system permease protein
MLKNYFKIALRNLARQKMFTFINISGLALSMSVCLLVLMRIKDQAGYDRFHPASSRMYRLITEAHDQQGNEHRLATTPLPLAPTISRDYGFIQQTARIYPGGSKDVSGGNKKLSVNAAFTDPYFFSVFGFTLEDGLPASSLKEPNSMVLSHKTAERFFGTGNALGKEMFIEGWGNFQVTGIMAEPPGKSHIDFDVFLSMASLPALEKSGKLRSVSDAWDQLTAAYTYVLLKKGNGRKDLEHAASQISAQLMQTAHPKGKENISFDVQPFQNIVLGEELAFNLGNTGSRGKMLAEIAISLIILLSACFNYTNLSIARSLKRGKEIGIRKVSGAFRYQIFSQFLVESLLLSLLSLFLAVGLLRLIMDFAPFSSEMVPAGARLNAGLIIWFFVFALFTGIIAGVLPAWALSAFKPVDVLKNLSNIKLFGSNGLRKTLIVTQFALSLVIIIFTITFFRQFRYMATADPGFNAHNVLTIPLQGSDPDLLRNQLASVPGIYIMAASSNSLGHESSGSVSMKKAPGIDPVYMEYYDVDPGFFNLMKLPFLSGQSFSGGVADGTETEVVISLASVQALSLGNPAAAVGQRLWIEDSIPVRVAGVIKNIYHRGMETPYRPLVFRYRPQKFTLLNLRTYKADDKNLVASVSAAWRKLNPHQDFPGTWLYDELYARKSAWGTISMLGFLALISITLAGLGLLGMVVYHAETRRKEIGIRKVMGASVQAIIQLLSKSFLRLVVWAGMIALPVSYLLGTIFLRLFANRTSMGWEVLVTAFLAILVFSLLIIVSQVYKVAAGNPVESLKVE